MTQAQQVKMLKKEGIITKNKKPKGIYKYEQDLQHLTKTLYGYDA